MSHFSRPLVGSVVERKPGASPSPSATQNSNLSGRAGFPAVQHRSKSVFAKGRDESRKSGPSRPGKVPIVAPSNPPKPPPDPDDWRNQISEENERKVENMSEAERERERQDVMEKFGPEVGDILRRAREARQGKPRKHPPPEEGTPEYIRRRFFPTAPEHDPNLEWMESSTPNSADIPESTSLRFDLTGTPIDPALSSSLPTHLGLHHHADGSRAGYTLDDIFLLSRSSVPAQRTTMLSVLGRIAQKLGNLMKGYDEMGLSELRGKEEELRSRILAAGVEAMNERGSLGVRAVEVMWECIIGWDKGVSDVEGVQLKEQGLSAGAISSLPFEYVCSEIANAFCTAALPRESLSQLLSIVHRLAQYTNVIASTVVSTPSLVANIIQTFLLIPISPSQYSTLPEPIAIQVLMILAVSNRKNASMLVEPADALLRFVTMLPPTSPYPAPLATTLLTLTLQFYAILGSYGLYAHISTTAAVQFSQLSVYILSPQCYSNSLKSAWARLLEVWTVCAIDPHQTTPSHEILWSQVVGWGWADDILVLREHLGTEEKDWEVWAALWNAEAAWLEGVKVNGVRSGEGERLVVVDIIRDGFENGLEKKIMDAGIELLRHELDGFQPGSKSVDLARTQSAATYASALASALRLWLSCLPPPSDRSPPDPPFFLPFAQFSELCEKLVTHGIWSFASSAHLLRSLTSLLSMFLQLSRRLPSTSLDLWMAQAFAVLGRLRPGDEEFAIQVTEDMTTLITPEMMASQHWHIPATIWDKRGMEPIKPFLIYKLRPKEDGLYIGPICPSPRSILLADTQRLPSSSESLALPLSRDWMLSPLDFLLHSGDSDVFKSLPPSWDASETDIVRSSLLLAKIAWGVLHSHGLTSFTMNRAETVLGCMKVFMLEHGQPLNDSVEEVFRDSFVAQLMEDLVAPFSVASSTNPVSTDDLEKSAARFLGSSTPFYQFYTDFVALYDAISFSHPTFSRLLLPPTSMRYPIDYRKHLWNDFSHVLKTIRISAGQVIVGNLREYFWPAESDPEMISAYLRALIRAPLDGFVRLLAVHHVACNIWPDLQEDGRNNDELASKLLKAVVDQGHINMVTEVVRYIQKRHSPYLLAPECFEQDGEWRLRRLACIGRFGGVALTDRLAALLEYR